MPLDFESRDTFLRCTRTPERIAPMTKLNPRFLVHCADPYRVLIFAISAAPQVTAVPFARLGVLHFVHFHAATLDARGIVSPALFLKKLNRHQFIGTASGMFSITADFERLCPFFMLLIYYLAQVV